MDILIRTIAEQDFAALISLFREFSVFEKQPDKMTNTVEQMQAEKQFINGFVAIDQSTGQIVGYATWFFAYYTWVGKSLYMDDLYVKPDYRGNYIGTKLINEVIGKAKKENCRRIRWQVSKWNEPAKKFYEKLGAVIEEGEANCDILFGNKG